VYAFLLNPQGHILGDLYAYNRGDYLLVETDQSQAEKVFATFDHYIIMDDVELTNISAKLTAVGLAGPRSRRVLEAAEIAVPELEPLELRDLVWQQVGLTLVRGENEHRESYEIWLAPENVNKLRDALIQAGAGPVGSAALELYRIASGIPRYGQDIRERDLPQETEQTRALHFNKGCYVGQEIVERIRSRGGVHRYLVRLAIDAREPPPPGTKIAAGDKEVGEITSAAYSPAAGQVVALGYVRLGEFPKEAPLAAAGAKVEISASPPWQPGA
jgi:folate-binding protein YgfZ